MVPLLVITLIVVLAFGVVKLVDWKVGYSRFINQHLRTPVGAALIVRDNKILLRFLPLGPFQNFWFLPSAYVHKEQRDKSTLDTACRKARELHDDLVIIKKTKLTGKRGRLSRLDTITYALQIGLMPTVIDIYEIAIKDCPIIPEDEHTKWCGENDLETLKPWLHPLVPDIIHLYFGVRPSVSSEQVEKDSRRIFQEEPERANQIKPVDELQKEGIIEADRLQ
jgi:hypothetical protein